MVYPLSGGSYTFSISPGMLPPDADTLTVQYRGDSTYLPETATTTVTVSKAAARITAIPSADNIESNVALTIAGTVTSTGGTPTGTVIVTGGGYTGSTAVNAGQYTLIIPPGNLSMGTDALTVTYSGDLSIRRHRPR